jgi:hypothetical protein
MRHLKYKPGSLVLLRQLDASGRVATTWGGQIVSTQPDEMRVLAIEMVYRGTEWHAVGDFREVAAPPHRVPYAWDFPRLLIQFEANPVDLEARPVVEAALERYRAGAAAPDEQPGA